MNCKQFEINAADWVKGRAPQDVAAQMAAHSASCAACGKMEASERSFLAAWQAIPMPRDAGELWPKVAARLDRQAPVRHLGLGRLAFGGTLATVLCVLIMFRPVPPKEQMNGLTSSPTEPTNTISMVAQMRELPDPDQEMSGVGLHSRRDFVLGGKE